VYSKFIAGSSVSGGLTTGDSVSGLSALRELVVGGLALSVQAARDKTNAKISSSADIIVMIRLIFTASFHVFD